MFIESVFKGKGFLISLFIFTMLILILINFVSAVECGSAPINGCTITQDTIFDPGTYNLRNGIEIGADNVILDCNNAVLNGSGKSSINNSCIASANGKNIGILICQKKNVTIKNCYIDKYNYGIIAVANFPGQNLYSNIINNQITNSKDRGIWFLSSNLNIIADNELKNNPDGIMLSGGNSNFISGNKISNSTYEAILVTSSSGNVIANNIVYDNQRGVWLWRTYLSKIINNTISKTALEGIFLSSDVNSTTIEDNTIKENNFGIALRITSDNIIKNNNVFNNLKGIGLMALVETELSNNETIVHNNIYDNKDYNLYITQKNNVNAEHNWWGTTSQGNIAAKIFDCNDDSRYGCVDFMPYLDSLWRGCYDGVKDGDEDGVDCGGSCPFTCNYCTPYIKNGESEDKIDLVFIPDNTYNNNFTLFKEHIGGIINNSFGSADLVKSNLDKFNFYYIEEQSQTDWENWIHEPQKNSLRNVLFMMLL